MGIASAFNGMSVNAKMDLNRFYQNDGGYLSRPDRCPTIVSVHCVSHGC